MSKYRILIIHDIHVETPKGTIGWAYWRRSQALAKYAPEDFEVDTCQTKDIPWSDLRLYSLIFQIEYCNSQSRPFRNKGFNGVWVVSYNSDANRRRQYWPPVVRDADFVIVNNEHAWKNYGKIKKTCVISNGVDTDVFKPTTPISDRPHKCIFAGSSGPTKQKGWPEVFLPLEERLPSLGFDTDFRPINDINPELVMPTQGTVDWYNDASYCLIASASEGTPNLATESVACGCVLVSVPVGNVLEWGKSGENCMIAERNADAFIEALQYAREHREHLSASGMQTIRDEWSYGEPGNRSQYFFSLFRRLIEDGPKTVPPFSFLEKHWSEI